jgi:hypothetical protein
MRKISEKQIERNKLKVENTKILHKLFLEIWDEREDESGYCYCFETNTPMHGSKYRGNTCCYDHVLEKGENSYPEYSLNKKNIIIILPDIHNNKGRDIDSTPRIKKYREELLKLHEKGEL